MNSHTAVSVLVPSTELVLRHISGFAVDLFGFDLRYPSYLKLNRSHTPFAYVFGGLVSGTHKSCINSIIQD